MFCGADKQFFGDIIRTFILCSPIIDKYLVDKPMFSIFDPHILNICYTSGNNDLVTRGSTYH